MKRVKIKNTDGVETFRATLEDPTQWLEDCIKNKVFGPDEYTVEIIDLSLDPEYLLDQCYKNRIAEYPSLGDQLDAFFHYRQGNASAFEDLDNQIKAVKLKYPKPN